MFETVEAFRSWIIDQPEMAGRKIDDHQLHYLFLEFSGASKHDAAKKAWAHRIDPYEAGKTFDRTVASKNARAALKRMKAESPQALTRDGVEQLMQDILTGAVNSGQYSAAMTAVSKLAAMNGVEAEPIKRTGTNGGMAIRVTIAKCETCAHTYTKRQENGDE